jgi:predicted nuclease of predicted toxin-antitoxin system
VKYLADENFPFPALAALRNFGYDVSSIAEEYAGSSDEVVAGICDHEARVLLTFDKDFGEMVIARGLSAGSSVVLFRISPEPAALVEVLRSLIDSGVRVCFASWRGTRCACGRCLGRNRSVAISIRDSSGGVSASRHQH